MFKCSNKKNGFTSLEDIKRKENNKTCYPLAGFTLLELIVTIFVVAIGLLAVYGVFSQITSYTTLSVSKLTAAYLAQEGIEIVRNIRDVNWLEEASWNDGLVLPVIDCSSSGCQADYNDDSLTTYGTGNPLNIENSGFYGYDSGTLTKFKRKIIITPVGADILNVSVSVEWNEKEVLQPPVTAQESLYNWYGQ